MKKHYAGPASGKSLIGQTIVLFCLIMTIILNISAMGQETVTTEPALEPGNVVNICQAGAVVVSVNNTVPSKIYTLSMMGVGTLQSLPGTGGTIVFNPVTYSSAGSFSQLVLSADFTFFMTFSTIVSPNPVATTLIQDPPGTIVEAGTAVSASMGSPGSGGYNCTDGFEFRTRLGATWGAWEVYTPETAIPTVGLSGVEIKSFRHNTELSRGCYDEQLYAWEVYAWSNISDIPPALFPTLQDAVDAETTTSGEIIQLAPGIYPVTEPVIVTKNVTIRGSGPNGTWNSKLTFSGAVHCFDLAESGVVIENLEIEKTDEAGPSAVMSILAGNCTVRHNKLYGQFNPGEPDITVGIEVPEGMTGLVVETNIIDRLLFPGRFTGSNAMPTTGSVIGNTTSGTAGWQVHNAGITFSDNNWSNDFGYNVYDIVILPETDATLYPDIVAISNVNNEAVIEDQRVNPSVLSVVYANPNFTGTTNGGRLYPFPSITESVGKVVPEGTIHAGTGRYHEQITINKSLNLIGSAYWESYICAPAIRTGAVIQDTTTWDYIVAAYPLSGTIDVRIEGFSIIDSNRNKTAGTDLLAGVFLRDIIGNDAGMFHCYVGGFPSAPAAECSGLKVFGNTSLAIENNTFETHTADGIGVHGGSPDNPAVQISNNYIYGYASTGNGISTGPDVTGSISHNNIIFHQATAPDEGNGIRVTGCSGTQVEHNNTVNCHNGVSVKNSNGLTIAENYIAGISGFGCILDNVSNSVYQRNSVEASLPAIDAGLVLRNGSTGNLVGGEGNANGFSLAEENTGRGIAILLEGSLETGNNTIIYNSFNAGNHFIMMEAGQSGTTIIDHNSFGGFTADSGSIAVLGGNAEISWNIFNPQTVRGILVDGAGNISIHHNTFNYGSSEFGIKIISSSGTKNISQNIFFGLTGTAFIAQDGADDFVFHCNSFQTGGANIGMVVESGCTGATITNNYFHYIAHQCILTYAPLLTVTNNYFADSDIGIETWSELNAHENLFRGCPAGAVILRSNDNHNLTNNCWSSWYGPRVMLNGKNVNTFDQDYQYGNTILANTFDNFSFAPWLQDDTDDQPDTCGYQSKPDNSFAPVYANADGSSTETEQYGSISDAIAKTGLPHVFAKEGYFTEQIFITKDLQLTGRGINTTRIVTPETRTGTLLSDTIIWDYLVAAHAPSGTIDVRIEGFSIQNNSFSKMPGSDCLAGVLFQDVSGNSAGLYMSDISGFPATAPMESYGAVVEGNSAMTIDSNHFHDYTGNGIRVSGGLVNILDNYLYGGNSSGNGIQIGTVPWGYIKYCHIMDHGATNTAGVFSESNDMIVSDNQFTQCFTGVDLNGNGASFVVSNNTFDGGKCHIRSNPGEAGWTHIGNNLFGYNKADSVSILIHSGDGMISNNSFHDLVTRGIILDGAGAVEIRQNIFTYLTSQFAVNVVAAEGPVTIVDNTVYALGGTAFIGGTVNQSLIVDCNHIFSAEKGISITENCNGAVIRNNFLGYCSRAGISAPGPVHTLYGNSFQYCLRGIETWNELEAHENAFSGSDSGAIVFNTNHFHDVTNNNWSSTSGPRVWLNGINVNPYNPEYQSPEFIQANSFDNFRYAPYLLPSYDIDSDSCGFQPDPANSFAPVYANADGSDSETELYGSINEAVNKSTLPYVFAKTGSFTEQVLITRDVILTGSRTGSTYLFPPVTRTGTVVEDTITWDYLMAADAPDGTINVKINRFIFNLGYRHKTEASNRFAALFLRNVSGVDAGLRGSTLTEFPQLPMECSGVRITGDSWLTVDTNSINSPTNHAIDVGSGSILLKYNSINGSSVSGSGIVFGAAARGEIRQNNIWNHTGPEAWGIAVAHDSIVISQNSINNCTNGLRLQDGSEFSVTGNSISACLLNGMVMDNVHNSRVRNNFIQNLSGDAHAFLTLSGGADGNLIGGEEYANHISQSGSGAGDQILINLEGSTGLGSNTFSHNNIGGGKQGIRINQGVTGLTIIDHNNFSASEENCIGIFDGNVNLSNNYFGNNLIRGVLVDGAVNVNLSNNWFNYGCSGYAVRLANGTGAKTITGNTFFGLAGTALIAEDGADGFVFHCNSFQYGGASVGMVVETGCTGSIITNNFFHYMANQCIKSYAPLLHVSNNFFHHSAIGIETWSELHAHHNSFTGCYSGALIFHSNDPHEVSNNAWASGSGPKVYLNGVNINTYNQSGGSDEFIQANDNDNFNYVPYFNGEDTNPDTCGYQPDTLSAFAPVYANADGSATETEQYGSINDALVKSALPYIRAKAGTFTEKVNIQRPVDIQGAGIDYTAISATSLTPGVVVTIDIPQGDVVCSGFNLYNNPGQDLMSARSASPASSITIRHNKFYGSGTISNADHGLLAGAGNLGSIVITGNEFYNTYNYPVWMNKNAGASRISHNRFEGSNPTIFFSTNGGVDISTRQQVDSNHFSLWQSDTTRLRTAIGFRSAFREDPAVSQGDGKFSDILIRGNQLNDLPFTVNAPYNGILLTNDDPDGTGGEITNAVIDANDFGGTSGTFAGAICLEGLINGSQVTDHDIRGVYTGIRCRGNNSGTGTQHPFNTNIENNLIIGPGTAGSCGVVVSGGNATLQHNPAMYYFTNGVMASGSAAVNIHDMTFYGNETAIAIGQDAHAGITSNTMYYNNYGIRVADNGKLDSCAGNSITQNDDGGIIIGAAAQSNAINGNTIQANGFVSEPLHGIGVKNENSALTIDARYNYWGGWPYQEPNNTCGNENAIIGKVDFLPILSYPGGDSLYPGIENVSRSPHSYYCKIQDAIDDAAPGDEIHVPYGYYTEQLTITKSLKLIGNGAWSSNIYAPESRDKAVENDTTTWDYIVAAYAPQGTIDFIMKGFNVYAYNSGKMEGTERQAAIFLRDVSGPEAGVFKTYISGFPQSNPTESSGVVVYGDASLKVDSNYIYNPTDNGIIINSGEVEIKGNSVYGSEISGNGIVMEAAATGPVVHNDILYCNGPESFGMIIKSDSILVSHNQMRSNRNGLMIQNADNVNVTYNFIHGNRWNGVVLDNVQNSCFQDNGVQDPPGEANACLILSNGSSGNMIGGNGHGNSFTLHQSGNGTLVGLYIPASAGAGNNIISHNGFSGGNKYIQIDAAYTGTTTIDNNTMGGAGAAECALVLNGGNVSVTNNSFGSGNIRALLADGVRDLQISHNTFSYGINDFAFNIVHATGLKQISNNSFFSINGQAVIAGDGADSLIISCNAINGTIGTEIQSGCTGVQLINNTFDYCGIAGVVAHEAPIKVTGNTFTNCSVGIDTWSDLDAHENRFMGNTTALRINGAGGMHDVSGNYWGFYGPKVMLQGNNLNTYYQQYQGGIIEAGNDLILFAPWLQNEYDDNPDSCGYQPVPGSSFAPVYANNDGSAAETEQFGSIGSGLTRSVMPYVFVKQGEFTEQVLIHRDVQLTGAGLDFTHVNLPSEGRVTVPGYSGDLFPGTPWNSDFLLAACPADPVSGNPVSVKVSGFTFNAMNQLHTGDQFTGAFFRKVYNENPASAGLFNSKITGFNASNPLSTGIRVLENARLTLDNNEINGYTLQGVAVQGTVNLPDPYVITGNQVLFPSGPAQGIVYYQINGTTVSGSVTGNTINGGTGQILADNSDHLSIATNSVSNSEDAGIRLNSSHYCSVTNNVVTNFVTSGIVISGDHNQVAGNTVSDPDGYCQNGIYLHNAMENTLYSNHISQIHSGNISTIESCGKGIHVDGTSSGNVAGDGTLEFANTLTSNDAGIAFAATGAGNSARGNKIHDNYPYGLNNSGGVPVDVSGNWWGSSKGPTSQLLNPCGNGDALTDGVNATFEPWQNNDLFDHDVYLLTAFEVAGPDTACTNVPATISLSGSQILQNGADYEYALYRDGSFIWGSTKPGTGDTLQWSVTESYQGEATYTVKSYNLLNGCEREMNGAVTIVVVPGPESAGQITGPAVVSPGQTDIVYEVEPIPNATGYEWILPPGVTITAGNNTHSITVSIGLNAYSGPMKVAGTVGCGTGPYSPELFINVNIPTTLGLGTETITDTRCYNALQTITVSGGGNTCTFASGANVTMIAGQKIRLLPQTIVLPGAYLHGYIAVSGNYCYTVPPAMVQSKTDIETNLSDFPGPGASFRIFPNPTAGKFTVELSENVDLQAGIKIEIFNTRGATMMTGLMTREKRHIFSLEGMAAGLYFIKINGVNIQGIQKLLKQ